MDFIERIFGLEPDGGSGATELLIVALVIAGLALAWAYRSRLALRSGPRQ